MAITEHDMSAAVAPELESAHHKKYKRTTFGIGLLKGLGITFRHLISHAVTTEYPDEKEALPARSRGVIALKEENCTVCMLCARECPDWCIYIEGHKESRKAAEGKRAKKYNVLDRFAIDYALCMYCGICVEVCPYDALFWAPEFEYAEHDITVLTHEMEQLTRWMYSVPPPVPLDEGAEGPVLKSAQTGAPSQGEK
jgi:NADH-quinone oxidoreductase subunit I